MNGTTQKLAQERKKRGDSGIEPQRAGTVQYLLTPEVQLRLDGTSEPVSEILVPVTEIEPPKVDSTQEDLFSAGPMPQPSLPFHAPVDGKPPSDCWKGALRGGKNADGSGKTQFHSVTCSRRACVCSEGINSWKRVTDLWDGTARSGRTKIGLRHVVGIGVDLSRMTVTVPPRFRHLLRTKKGIQKLRSSLAKGLMKWLAKCIGVENALFYVREYFHPCGEDPTVYHPHFNFLIPAVFFDKGQGRGRGFKPWRTLEEFRLFREMVAQCFVKVFKAHVDADEVEFESAEENVNWRYEQIEEKKRHMAKYNSRLEGFSRWDYLMVRPASFGLAHAKNRRLLEDTIETKDIKPLPEWKPESGCYVTAIGQSEEEVEAALEKKAEIHREECSSCLATFNAVRLEQEGLLSRKLANHTDGQARSTADPPLQVPIEARYFGNLQPNLP
jgi:hypothetical protein